MIVAIHQPNFLPWLGYFYKIWASDVFIFHDNVEYTKKSFIKRVYIRQATGSAEKTYLTVPLKKHSDFARIKDLYIDSPAQWLNSHLHKIRNAYSKAPYFPDYFSLVESAYQRSVQLDRLSEYNVFWIKEIMQLLDLPARTFYSSSLDVPILRSDAYNAALTKAVGGTVYLSGVGAKKYQHEKPYLDMGIELRYADFGRYLQDHPYLQRQGPFLNGLSVLNALFNIGKEGIIALFQASAASDLSNDV